MPCLCGNTEEGHYFENQQTSTFVTFVPRHRMPGRPERDRHSVLINDEKVLCSPLNPLTVYGGNVMTEVESAPASTKKRTIMLWPSVVALALLFAFWVFFYDDELSVLFWLGLQFFGAISLVWLVCLIVLERVRKSLSFFIPILLAASMGWWPVTETVTRPILTAFRDSRNYVEFLIYDAKHHIRAEARQNRYGYRVWHLCKHSASGHDIVYDASDETLMQNNVEEDNCYSVVFSLGEHFYFVTEGCVGFP